MRSLTLFIVLIILSQLCGYVFCKTCTNAITSSHTFRYELHSSKNETWKKEMFSHYHLTPTDDSAWSSLFPRKMLKEGEEHDWAMFYKKIKNSGGVKGVTGLLSEVPLNDVRLDPNSLHGQAQQTNLEYLLMLDVDRLVWSFRKTAGFETPGKPYGGWEAPDVELRGHFVGHYLSATAQMWASTHNETIKEKMNAVVSVLSACQKKMGTGYLSAFPSELFDRFEAVQPVWAPYYTIHKILAGLFDQYTLAGNEEALKIMLKMVDYFYNRVQNVISKYTIERQWDSLNEESGGMNDILYKLYSITGDQKHLTLAHLFDKPCFLGLLAVKADDIAEFHSNTHIPVVIGSQMRYEVTGDPLYKEIGTYFMDIVNASHSYATGGTSVGEFWKDPKRLATTLETENEESCTTYNMLKVARHLFRWTKEMEYADHYERALTNGVLSIQRGRDPGIMIYMLPLGPGTSKAVSYHGWGTQFDSFWCCYGTGIESFSKLGDSIYFEEAGKIPSLYLIQYISSTLNWRSANISLTQIVEPAVSWDPRLRVKITFSSKQLAGAGGVADLNLRMPLWTNADGAKASLNGQDISLGTAGNFLSISKYWSPGDKITLEMPMKFRIEAIKDDRPEYASVQAILFGPYLLAGLTDGDWDINATSATSYSDWITPIPSDYNSHLVSLSQKSFSLSNSNGSLTMENAPQQGTNSAVASSFRLILNAPIPHGNLSDTIGKVVMLEPFNLPGMVISHHGDGKNLSVASGSSETSAAQFRVVAGLDGKSGTVSLEAVSKNSCFVYSGVGYKNGTSVKLSCGSGDEGFKEGASFSLGKGMSEYHPISFVAKGMQRNFVLAPLFSLRDETYTVYFDIHS